MKCKNQRTNIASRCKSSLLICFDTEKLVEKKMPDWSNEVKQNLKMVPHWSAQKWIDVRSKGGGQKKWFQYCLKPDDPGRLCTFEPFKVIQEELILEMLLLILYCKTMYCYR